MSVRINSYAELIGDEFLNVSRADAVARELAAGHEIVAYAPAWLVNGNRLPSSEFDEEIVAGEIEHETEKAYLIAGAGIEEWFPKSVIRVYEVAPDAEISGSLPGSPSVDHQPDMGEP